MSQCMGTKYIGCHGCCLVNTSKGKKKKMIMDFRIKCDTDFSEMVD